MNILIGWTLIILGLFTILSGIIGLFRFPDFYTKLHAAGVIDSCGIPLSLLGLAFLQYSFINSFKLLCAALLIFILNPASTHALVRIYFTANK